MKNIELVLITVIAILVILQVTQIVQKKNPPQGTTPGITNTEDIKNIVRDSLDTAIARLTEQARTDRDEAIKLGSQQVSKDSAEHLGSRADTINQTLTSIKNAMDKKIEDLDKELREFRENNKSQFDNVEIAVGALARTTGNLNQVLSSSQKRGQWGERMAEDMLRAAGLIEGINFRKQTENEEGKKPDYELMMPPNRVLIMDVKFPYDQYLTHINAESDAMRLQAKSDFVKAVKTHVDMLAKRDYISNSVEESLDYVLMFVPNESISGFVHEADPTLIDYALSQKIVLCSPLTLYAFLVVIRQATDSFHTELTAASIMQQINKFNLEWDKYSATVEKVKKSFDTLQSDIDSIGVDGTRFKKLKVPVKEIEKMRKKQGITEYQEPETDNQIENDDFE
jgi:DNA recombination protein RmuC